MPGRADAPGGASPNGARRPAPMTRDVVRAGVARAARAARRRAHRPPAAPLVDLRAPGLSRRHARSWRACATRAASAHLGVTNFDTDHLRLLVDARLPGRRPTRSRFSLLDRRAAEEMSAFCLEHGVRLLAYGTLGRRLPHRPLARRGRSPHDDRRLEQVEVQALHRRRSAAGRALQTHPAALAEVAAQARRLGRQRRDPLGAGAAGRRGGDRRRAARRARAPGRQPRACSPSPSTTRTARAIDAALADTRPHPRRLRRRVPPAALPHRLRRPQPPSRRLAAGAPGRRRSTGRPDRLRIDSGSVWEPICGYSRAVRIGDRILVSGTTATHGSGEVVCPGDPARPDGLHPRQDRGEHRAPSAAAWRTSCAPASTCSDAGQWEPVARVHGRYFGDVRPANTLVEARGLIGAYEVEIEAEAVVD